MSDLNNILLLPNFNYDLLHFLILKVYILLVKSLYNYIII